MTQNALDRRAGALNFPRAVGLQDRPFLAHPLEPEFDGDLQQLTEPGPQQEPPLSLFPPVAF
jgi:hypothetical protein